LPKSERGDDVSANIIPVCGDGSRLCHGALHGSPYYHQPLATSDKGYSERRDAEWVRRRIGENLRPWEHDYLVYKLGGHDAADAYLERHYG